MKRLTATLGVLAGLVYFLRRRQGARDRALALFRRAGRGAEGGAAETSGLYDKATHQEDSPKAQPNDATLAHKVETEIFRDRDVPRGQINVNAEEGKVFLRGVVETPELIDELVAMTRNVQGVRDVENLLHLPDTPTPH